MKNPFGVLDVPDPNDEEVMQFAARATLQESADDENAWVGLVVSDRRIDGKWTQGRLDFRR
jgi:hypothetical protein